MSSDGSWAIAWTDARRVSDITAFQGFQDVTVIDLRTPQPAKPKVIQGQPLDYMNQMMRQVLVSGTGTRAAVSGFDLAGKTGTTSDFHDAWFIGFTGGFTTAVWIGRDDRRFHLHRRDGAERRQGHGECCDCECGQRRRQRRGRRRTVVLGRPL